MAEVTFGGTALSPYQSSAGWVYSNISVPKGRTCANGQGPVIIYQLLTYIGGYGGTRSVTTSFAGSSVGYSAGADSTPSGTWRNSSNALVANGGTYQFQHNGGPFYGRRNSSGGYTYGQYGNWSAYWAGGFRYYQAPSVPQSVTVESPTAGVLDFEWSAPADDGDTSVTGYRVQAALNSGFTTGLVESDVTDPDASLAGLQPGATYYYRVAAKNAVTEAASTVGPWSSTETAQVLTGLKVGVDDAWVDAATYVGINGEWVPCAVFAGVDGAWVSLE